MISVEGFISPVKGSREYNAVKKAVKEKPEVTRIDGPAFKVKGYELRLWADADGKEFIECSCPAGSPTEGLDPQRGYEPVPCYHSAAVLIFLAEEKEK